MSNDRLRAVEKELAELNGMLPEYMKRIDGYLERISSQCEEHDHWINGNGEPGAKVRVDRLEQDHQKRRGWAKAGAGAFIMLVVERVWAHLSQ